MKRFFVLAVIALTSVAMISCGGEKKDEKKPAEATTQVVKQSCDHNCSTCPQAATCAKVNDIYNDASAMAADIYQDAEATANNIYQKAEAYANDVAEAASAYANEAMTQANAYATDAYEAAAAMAASAAAAYDLD